MNAGPRRRCCVRPEGDVWVDAELLEQVVHLALETEQSLPLFYLHAEIVGAGFMSSGELLVYRCQVEGLGFLLDVLAVIVVLRVLHR
jgi:hypothetical protein